MANDENGANETHVGSYKEAGYMLDQWICSCGWESYPYFDGYVYAKEEWEKHVEDSNRGFENNN